MCLWISAWKKRNVIAFEKIFVFGFRVDSTDRVDFFIFGRGGAVRSRLDQKCFYLIVKR